MITVFIFCYSLYIKNVRKIFTLVSFCFCFIFSSNRKCKMVAKFSGLGTVFPSKSRIVLRYSKAVTQRCSVKEVILEISQNSQKNTCARVSFLTKLQGSGLNFIKKEDLAHVFFYKFCNNFISTFFYRTPLVAASRYFTKMVSGWQRQKYLLTSTILVSSVYIRKKIWNLSWEISSSWGRLKHQFQKKFKSSYHKNFRIFLNR